MRSGGAEVLGGDDEQLGAGEIERRDERARLRGVRGGDRFQLRRVEGLRQLLGGRHGSGACADAGDTDANAQAASTDSRRHTLTGGGSHNNLG